MTTALWRAAGDPRGAHDLCAVVCPPRRYAHSRGVAQQAARAARGTRLAAGPRRVLLSAAWLHDIGYGLDEPLHARAGARALRRAGHERLARIVAHHGNAAARMRADGWPDLAAEFPCPRGGDVRLLVLLDVADLLTGPDGERVDPARRLADVVERRGPGSPAVRALVENVNRLAADPGTRALVEQLSAPAVAG